MPELPEVQTVVNQLAAKLKGGVFESAEVKAPKMVSKNFCRRIKNRKINKVFRLGKMIIMELDTGDHLAAHLKMTGQLIFMDNHGRLSGGGHPINFRGFDLSSPNKFTRVVLGLKGGGQVLFHDIRKFGWLRLLSPEAYQKAAAALGVDPLSKPFTLRKFQAILNRRPKMKIKQLLMSQELIAGIGNIYADESLFAGGIMPTRLAGKVKPAAAKKLRQKIIRILKQAIRLGGTSVNTFLHPNGGRGGFVEKLKVYQRGNQPCFKCGTSLKKIKLAGRGTVYCPNCQK